MMKIFNYLWSILLIALVFPDANAALLSRAGGRAVYDTDLDITWIADPALATSNTFGLSYNTPLPVNPSDTYPGTGSILANGTMNYAGALRWIEAMNSSGYLGVNDWRLPVLPLTDPSCSNTDYSVNMSWGSGCTLGELAHLRNVELKLWQGGPADPSIQFFNQYGDNAPIQFRNFWYGVDHPTSVSSAFYQDFKSPSSYSTDGWQYIMSKDNYMWALPVHPGDVVPLPAAVWLFLSGLSGLWLAGRRATRQR